MFEYSLSTRENVKQSYLYSGKTQKQIAEEFGVAERTIRHWIKQFRWHELKHRIHHPPSSLIEGITIQLTNLQNKILSSDHGIPTAEQALIMQKLLCCLKKLNNTPELSALINIIPLDEETEIHTLAPSPSTPVERGQGG